MTLTAEQLKLRDGRLTASRVSCLMTGDEQKIMDLWRLMVGETGEQSLSDVWPVVLGEATEALNLSWYERTTGRKLTRRGEVVICPSADWAAATLDGWDDVECGPVDAKHVGGFEPRETVVTRYMPQMMWQMICTCSSWSALSIIEGARKPVVEVVLWDETYAMELWRRAEAFMECVETLTPPVVMAPVAPPVAPVRTVSMEGSNIWAVSAAQWLANQEASRQFDRAAKSIRELVTPDMAKAHGHGIEAERDARGAIRIRSQKS